LIFYKKEYSGMARIIIGRKDTADFPQLELEGIAVKTDSGAYTSSFHCHEIEHFSKEGIDWVKCRFLDPLHHSIMKSSLCSGYIK
jgi:hypothetical protein